MKNSESVQLVKEQLKIKSIELRKATESNNTINNKIKTLITDNQTEVKKLKSIISKKDTEILNTQKEVRVADSRAKQAQETAKHAEEAAKQQAQGVNPNIIKKVKELKEHTEKLRTKIKNDQQFTAKFSKEKEVLLKELKRLKKEEGKVEELHKRVEKFKRELAKAQSSSNEVDESTQELIHEKDKLIKKLRDMASKGMEAAGIADDERFKDMPPPEIIMVLVEDVKKLEKEGKKAKRRLEMAKETSEELQMKLNLAVEDKEKGTGGGMQKNEARSASTEEFGGGLEAFLLTYADMITLLLVIFVMMYTASNLDEEKFAEAMSSFQEKIVRIESVNVRLSKDELSMLNKLRELVKDNIDPDALIAGNTRTMVFKIPSSDLFGPGSADLKEGAGQLIVETIEEEMQDSVKQVVVDGHTDNVPTKTAKFPSNWELSSARAGVVARYIIKQMRYDPKFVVVSGYGEFRPMKPNTSDDNRASNRRVEIKIVKDKDVAAAIKAKKRAAEDAAEAKARGF